MLQAHSFLWHYLWVAPDVLLLSLAFLLWRGRIHHVYPAFFAFTVIEPTCSLLIYGADLAPWVSPEAWWRLLWACLVVEGIAKFAVLAEIFDHAFRPYASIAKLARILIRGVGVTLVFSGALAAAYAAPDGKFGIISGAHLLQQTIYLVETGLLVFVFAFSGYFRLRLERPVLGIALGLAISSCVHLAVWALIANGGFSNPMRGRIEFLNMGAFHSAVLVWFYYLLVPRTVPVESAVPLPENDLAVWNRELERLLQQ